MSITIARLTVSEAATFLNAIISFVQYTLGLALVALLVMTISNVNSAITWSVISRELHASLWPTLLRMDSSHDVALRVTWLSRLVTLSTILAAVAGVTSPLGLKSGALVTSHNFQPMSAVYIKDLSPLASATSPRSSYSYIRPCNFLFSGDCPGNTTAETVDIDPSVIEQFNSTPHGPFNLQFRRYFRDILVGQKNVSVIEGEFITLESYVHQYGLYAVEGAILDLTETPGIGLTNHTMPQSLKYGATWSQEVLWLEPATSCLNTNLTIDYSIGVSPDDYNIDNLYLTDRGGFVNLTTNYPQLVRDGQHIDLYHHAYAGAVLSNRRSMIALNNVTRNQSRVGKAFNFSRSEARLRPGAMQTIPLVYLPLADSSQEFFDVDNACKGYNSQEIANITNVSVHCGAFLGPPYRTDGGDNNLLSKGSKWRQDLHVCASATKASVQRVDYFLNTSSTANLTNLRITRSPIAQPVLWAVEKTEKAVGNVAIYWGRVADSYESHPNLETIRAKEFYIPTAFTDDGGRPEIGQAHTAPGVAWYYVYNFYSGSQTLFDYSASTNAALLRKYEAIISSNHTQGVALICNLIWTDIIANALVGTDMSTVLTAAKYHPSITYDLIYGIPLIMLAIIWLPSFTMALFLLESGALKFSDIKKLLNHTSVGRLVTGYSALAVHKIDVDSGESEIPMPSASNEKDWASTAGRTLLSYNPKGAGEEPKEEIELLRRSATGHNADDSH